MEVFLFEKAVLICKRKSEDPTSLIHLNNLYNSPQLHHPQTPNQQLLTNSNNSNPFSSSTSTLSSVSSSSSGSSHQNTHHPSVNFMGTNSLSSSSSAAFGSFQYFYQFKEMIKTNEIGLTENVKSEKKKFELWSETCSYVFEAHNEQEKHHWTVQIKSLLENQLNEMKCIESNLIIY